MESFFSAVKSELADRFDSFGEGKMALFDYIEVFHNQRRRHSTLGQISPAAFERRHTAAYDDEGALGGDQHSIDTHDGHATERPSAFCDYRTMDTTY